MTNPQNFSTDTAVLTALNRLAAVFSQDVEPHKLLAMSVQVFREVFDADRVWLLYPCDPETPSCQVRYEETLPDYPGLLSMDGNLEMTSGVVELFRDALAVETPVVQIQGAGKAYDTSVVEKFAIRSRLSIALKMKNDRPWLLGMHQCGYRREWTETEVALFQYAAQRLSEAYDSRTLLQTIKHDIAKRQRVEIELTRSEQRFKSFFQSSSVSLWLVDVSDVRREFRILQEDGIVDLAQYFAENPIFYQNLWKKLPVLDVNRATLQLFEISSKERFINNVHRIYTRLSIEALKSFYMATFSGLKHISLETAYKTFKENPLEAIVNFDLLPGDESFALVSIVDISHQKMLEKTLIESGEQYKKLLETANDAILIADAETGLILQANRKAEQLTGYSKNELIGLHQTTLHPPKEKSSVEDIFLRHSIQGNQDRQDISEVNILCADGQHIPVEISASTTVVNGKKIVQGIFRDLRSRIAGEEHVRLLATVTEQTDDSVIITDIEGKVSYVNPAFERVSGYQLSEILGRTPGLIKSNHHDAGFYRALWDTLKRGEVWQGTLINKTKFGTLYEEDAIITPVKDHRGKVKNYVAVKRDKTRQHSLEKQVRQAQKMQAVGTLAGGIAHDFNNILTAILGFAELSLLQCEGNTLLQENLQEIIKGSERAGNLINQILTFSRQTEKNVAALQVSIIIKEALKLLRASLPANIDIIEDLDPALMARVDPTQMHQVLMNLCANASQAISIDQGWIKVSTRSVNIAAVQGVEIGNLSPGNYVCLQVEDNGQGISPEFLGRIFEPYFTTKIQNEGTGLGLSVVHGIVNDHGGAVTVESTLGVGSCFTVYLPQISSQESRAGSKRQELVTGTGRVLVVDDEQQIVDYELQVLKKAGYDPVGFTDSLTAMGALIADPQGYDLVVTDMAMPEMTGLQLFNKIQKIRPGMRVLLCTGYSEHVTEESSQQMGLNGYLAKPFTADQFAVEVKRVLQEGPRQREEREEREQQTE